MDLSKSYYKIAEVAEMLDTPASTLRYWENMFDALSPMRSTSGRRFYTSADIELLEIIRFLVKDKGMKIEAAKEQLAHNKANLSRRIEMIKTLKDARAELTLILQGLEKRR